jgi:hypothetical protein
MTEWCLSIISPLQYLSDDVIVGEGKFPTHFSVKNIRPSLTTSESGLIALDHLKR